MKAGIHPKYVLATVHCACGNEWQTMSTREVLKTDLCSKCHPFYTGEQRIIDTAGQVERFMRRMNNRTQPTTQEIAAGNTKRVSRNKANVPPPPQERRPAPRPQAEDNAEGADSTDVAEAVATEA